MSGFSSYMAPMGKQQSSQQLKTDALASQQTSTSKTKNAYQFKVSNRASASTLNLHRA